MARMLNLSEGSEGDVVAVFPSMQAARTYLERTAEWALSLLDDLDGDTDVEPDLAGALSDLEEDNADLEPSYGSLGGTADRVGGERMSQELWASGLPVGAMGTGDEAEDDDPAEPSLGSLDRQSQLVSYRQGIGAAGEPDLEGDDRGRDPDLEPSLGSLNGTARGCTAWCQWSVGSRDDREEENEHGGDINDERHDEEQDSGGGPFEGGSGI
jgi:hypothetical protein